jgi:hypothetical protein
VPSAASGVGLKSVTSNATNSLRRSNVENATVTSALARRSARLAPYVANARSIAEYGRAPFGVRAERRRVFVFRVCVTSDKTAPITVIGPLSVGREGFQPTKMNSRRH